MSSDLATGRFRAPVDALADADCLELDALPASARKARAFVSERCPTTVCDTARLLTSELVTNGVLHAGTPLVLRVRAYGDSIVVGLTDGNTRLPVPNLAQTERTGGRGLALIDALATRWGWVDDARGKTVWFLLTAGDA